MSCCELLRLAGPPTTRRQRWSEVAETCFEIGDGGGGGRIKMAAVPRARLAGAGRARTAPPLAALLLLAAAAAAAAGGRSSLAAPAQPSPAQPVPVAVLTTKPPTSPPLPRPPPLPSPTSTPPPPPDTHPPASSHTRRISSPPHGPLTLPRPAAAASEPPAVRVSAPHALPPSTRHGPATTTLLALAAPSASTQSPASRRSRTASRTLRAARLCVLPQGRAALGLHRCSFVTRAACRRVEQRAQRLLLPSSPIAPTALHPRLDSLVAVGHLEQ